MSKFFFAFSFLIFVNHTSAQLTHAQGEWIKRKNTATHQGFLFADSTRVFSVDFRNNRFSGKQALYTNIFDKTTGNYIDSKLLESLNYREEQSELTEVFSLFQSFFTVTKNKPESENANLVIQKIDKLGLKKNRIEIALESYANRNEFDYEIITDDKKSSFVVAQNIPQSASKKQNIILKCYNENLKLIWTRTIQFKDKDKQFILKNFHFDGVDQLTFTGQNLVDLYQPDLQSSKKNSYYLFRYDGKIDRLKEIELDLNERSIIDLKTSTKDGNTIVCGTYAERNSVQPSGIFNIHLDENFVMINNHLHDFTEDDRKNFSNSTKRKSKKIKPELNLQEILVLNSGEFVVLIEEFQKEYDVANDREIDANNYTETFIYGNIIHFKFDGNGAWKNTGVIRKKQVSVNDDGENSSFVSAQSENKNIIILFNDNPKNINKNNKVSTTGRKTFLRVVQINQNGAHTTKPLTSASRSKKINPQKCSQLLDGKIYLLSVKRRKTSLIIVQ